jgi:hypothetical protein
MLQLTGSPVQCYHLLEIAIASHAQFTASVLPHFTAFGYRKQHRAKGGEQFLFIVIAGYTRGYNAFRSLVFLAFSSLSTELIIPRSRVRMLPAPFNLDRGQRAHRRAIWASFPWL